jgi:glycosyltransferase involved in cell wall biosynthesis
VPKAAGDPHDSVTRDATTRPRVVFVVQRYGPEVCGGAEHLCRLVAERMVRHWDLQVLTTRAVDHHTWANALPEGTSDVNGVRVRRLTVDRPCDKARMDRVHERLPARGHTLADEHAWIDAQGPAVGELLPWLREAARDTDFFVFFTYLFTPTVYGLPAVAARSMLVPAAHDEPALRMGIFRPVFAAARALVFSTPEERDLVNGRFGTGATTQGIVGVGVDAPADVSAARFRAAHPELGDDDLLVYAGRVERGKGAADLARNFIRYRAGTTRPVRLVLLGAGELDLPPHPRIARLGWVTEQEKFDAIAAASVVVIPSWYESLSIVALEAWRLGRPVLVNAGCDVLRGQCLRSNGGLWYEAYPDFREALTTLLDDPDLRARLGAAGRAFVDREYAWDVIESKYMAIAERAFGDPGVRQASA